MSSQVLQIVFVSTPSLIYMGHAMHTVRREEKRRSREESEGGGGGEEDPGGGEGGGGGGGGGDKQGRKEEKDEEKEKSDGSSGGRIRLKGALLKTYVLSILIRSIMEVNITDTRAPRASCFHGTHTRKRQELMGIKTGLKEVFAFINCLDSSAKNYFEPQVCCSLLGDFNRNDITTLVHGCSYDKEGFT